jgi:hypothetical protein
MPDPNFAMLQQAATKLGPLVNEVVFIRGALRIADHRRSPKAPTIVRSVAGPSLGEICRSWYAPRLVCCICLRLVMRLPMAALGEASEYLAVPDSSLCSISTQCAINVANICLYAYNMTRYESNISILVAPDLPSSGGLWRQSEAGPSAPQIFG